jgi:hypothetical protein
VGCGRSEDARLPWRARLSTDPGVSDDGTAISGHPGVSSLLIVLLAYVTLMDGRCTVGDMPIGFDCVLWSGVAVGRLVRHRLMRGAARWLACGPEGEGKQSAGVVREARSPPCDARPGDARPGDARPAHGSADCRLDGNSGVVARVRSRSHFSEF